MPYDLKNYVSCSRAELPKSARNIADQIESLGFTVEHHKHIKGGAHASQIWRCGIVVLPWCYGASLADFLKGAASVQTLAAPDELTSDEIECVSTAVRGYIAQMRDAQRTEPNAAYANENRRNWETIAISAQKKLGLSP